jgi:hypothetical protein
MCQFEDLNAIFCQTAEKLLQLAANEPGYKKALIDACQYIIASIESPVNETCLNRRDSVQQATGIAVADRSAKLLSLLPKPSSPKASVKDTLNQHTLHTRTQNKTNRKASLLYTSLESRRLGIEKLAARGVGILDDVAVDVPSDPLYYDLQQCWSKDLIEKEALSVRYCYAAQEIHEECTHWRSQEAGRTIQDFIQHKRYNNPARKDVLFGEKLMQLEDGRAGASVVMCVFVRRTIRDFSSSDIAKLSSLLAESSPLQSAVDKAGVAFANGRVKYRELLAKRRTQFSQPGPIERSEHEKSLQGVRKQKAQIGTEGSTRITETNDEVVAFLTNLSKSDTQAYVALNNDMSYAWSPNQHLLDHDMSLIFGGQPPLDHDMSLVFGGQPPLDHDMLPVFGGQPPLDHDMSLVFGGQPPLDHDMSLGFTN